MSTPTPKLRRMAFSAGDLLFLSLVGAAASVLMSLTHETGWAFALCLTAGMAAAMLLQTALSLCVSPLLGAIESMVPAMAVAMIAPMSVCAFHMADRELSWSASGLAGAVFAAAIWCLLVLYGRSARRAGVRPDDIASKHRDSAKGPSSPRRVSSQNVASRDAVPAQIGQTVRRDIASAERWDWRARCYDLCEGVQWRHGPDKQALFADMRGRTLFLAVGTGRDIRYFPPGREIIAIDFSEEMLKRARPRAAHYPGALTLAREDAMHLSFADDFFDTVATSCTLCSVPDPARVLDELRRVLRPGGCLLMFEHGQSRSRALGWTLDLMTLWTKRLGTHMNRDPLGATQRAGFLITSVESLYLDIILAIRAIKPGGVPAMPGSADHLPLLVPS